MAGLPWFELDVDMPDDPKCLALGARLRNPLAFGYVVRLYAYCYRHASDAFASKMIETAAGWRGRSGALVTALVAEGFLDREGDRLVVHGVRTRLAPHLAKLERDRARSRGRRADVARTIGRFPRDVSGDRDRDKDRDLHDREASVQPQIDPVSLGGAGGKP
jgi:hypothetical protein